MKKLLTVIMLLLITTTCLTACFEDIDNNPSSSSKYELIGNFESSIDYDSYFGYSIEIKGKLKNTSSKEFTYVSVTFAIYDSNGNQIETALDNMNYLQPGSTWQFNATMLGWTDVKPKSFKLVEVTAW